ncbi:MAG: tetratricopeptide repeat protein, partial [Pirellulales bacterium]
MTRPALRRCCLVGWALLLLLTPAAAQNADQELAKARRLLSTGKYAEAEEAYQALAAAEPVAAALGAAECLVSTGKLEEAAAMLATSIGEHPEAAPLHAAAAQLAFDRGDYEAARHAVEAALAIDAELLAARWIQAELWRTAGELDKADQACKWFVDYYNTHEVASAESLRWIGLAAAQFARWNRLSDQFAFFVNELYPDALELDEEYWPAHYESGLLFLEKYNQADASRAFGEALKLNPNAAPVYAALARLALQNFEVDDATRALDRAQAINPGLAEAHRGRGDVQLTNLDAAEAVEAFEKALAVNPASEASLGRLAAALVLLEGPAAAEPGGRAGKLVEQATARNPHAGEFFYSMGEGLELSRRFPAAARYYREALARMPRLTAPRGALGLMAMRLGDEAEAKRLLDESHEIDPFNVRVGNSLKVLEVLDGYAVLETEHFVIKFDRVADELLARYAARYLEDEVYPELVAQFGFEPEGKSLFEFFCRARNTSGHGWFSARMVGLPYVGTVGACAGKIVALASPNDMPKKYNWARVLKHEFVHVLNLQQTEFNIPHWFTEALAVESEGYPRPQTWNDLLSQRVPRGELFNLDTINLGFIRPKSSLDWQMAYCQAQLYVQYMKAAHGADAAARLLQAYRANLDTRSALKQSFGVEQEAFEQGYREHLAQVVQGLASRPKPAPMTLAELERARAADPQNAEILARLAQAHLLRKAYPEARKLARQAIAGEPKHQLAHYVLA